VAPLVTDRYHSLRLVTIAHEPTRYQNVTFCVCVSSRPLLVALLICYQVLVQDMLGGAHASEHAIQAR
jgi:hypothetical protein